MDKLMIYWAPAASLKGTAHSVIEELAARALSFLAVVTAGATAYRRDDGVLVIPLACLRP